MDNVVGKTTDSLERRGAVKVSDHRNRAKSTQGSMVPLGPRKSIYAPTAAKRMHEAQADVSAADN